MSKGEVIFKIDVNGRIEILTKLRDENQITREERR